RGGAAAPQMARLRSRARGPSAGPFGVGADGPRRGRQAPAANVPRLPRAGGSLLLDFAAGPAIPSTARLRDCSVALSGFPKPGLRALRNRRAIGGASRRLRLAGSGSVERVAPVMGKWCGEIGRASCRGSVEMSGGGEVRELRRVVHSPYI